MKTVKIPIAPHLKKFMMKRYKSAEPLEVTEKDLFGSVIMKILMDKRQHKFTHVLENYTDRIWISLTQDMQKRTPRLNRLVYVNVELAKIFKESLFTWIESQLTVGHPATDGIKSFLVYYKIDENEYSFDAAHRAWIRFKN